MVDPDKPRAFEASETSPLIRRAAPIVSSWECQQHLKLVRCFYNLKQTVQETTGLFKTEHSHDIHTGLDAETRQLMVKERRWSIYLMRAIHRFSIWWACLPVSNSTHPEPSEISEKPVLHNNGIWRENTIPPLDVLMVLHSLVLHSRAFAEDCIRHRKMALWSEGFPLGLAEECIDSDTLRYTCSDGAKEHFQRTGLAWDNLHDPDSIPIECYRCQKQIQVPWTTRRGKGFADDGFIQQCRFCGFSLGRRSLLVQRLRQDLHLLLAEGFPLPGTCPDLYGDFNDQVRINVGIKTPLREFMLEETRPTNLFPDMTGIIEGSVKVVGSQDVPVLHDIFSHYQYASNSSCDLYTAVTSVLEWVSRIHDRDWRQMADPDLSLVEAEYTMFLQRRCKGSRDIAVKSMADAILLVWATHQLSSHIYDRFSRSTCNGVLVDWAPAHQSTTCKVCPMLRPSSFTRRFLQIVTHPAAWLSGVV